MKFNIFKKSKWPELPLDEIRKRSRLLVIDDLEFYYLDLFKKDGYQIEKWDDIEDLTKLESGYFDIILLDLQGVGRKQSQDQGFGILKHCRKVCPTQIIIAYSNADWPVKYQDFFIMADAVLPKQKDYVDFKRTVDDLLQARFSLGFYVDRISKLLSPHISDLTKAQSLSRIAILQKSPADLENYLIKNVEHKETIKMVLQIVSIGIQIAAIAFQGK